MWQELSFFIKATSWRENKLLKGRWTVRWKRYRWPLEIGYVSQLHVMRARHLKVKFMTAATLCTHMYVSVCVGWQAACNRI